MFNADLEFSRKTMKESFKFRQEKSICLASTFGSRVNYFMLFSNQIIYQCFAYETIYAHSIGTKENQNIGERDTIS